MNAALIAGVLWGTIAAFMPANVDSCAAPLSGIPEPGIRQVWIRVRDWSGPIWRDTVRYSVPAEFAHGGRLPLPYVHRGAPQLAEAAAVDSAGNVSCWSEFAVIPRAWWPWLR